MPNTPNGPVGFLDFVHVPKRLNRSTRKRKSLTSYSLTSDQHIPHISEVLSKRSTKQSASGKKTIEQKKQVPEKKSATKAATVRQKNASVNGKTGLPDQQSNSTTRGRKRSSKKKHNDTSAGTCNLCKVSYGDPFDGKKDEDWLSCFHCHAWFHQTCVEDSGVMDDDYYICKNCIA